MNLRCWLGIIFSVLILEGILLEYKSGLLAWLALTLWSIEYSLIRVQSLYQCCSWSIRLQPLLVAGLLGCESSDVFLCWGFL